MGFLKKRESNSTVDPESPERDGVQIETAKTLRHGEAKFHKLGWKRLTICLIVEAIALGALSIPKVFATVGMVAGVIMCVGLGLVAIYTSYIVGQVFLKYPHIRDYAQAVGLMWGKWGYWITSAMFVLYLTFVVGSHALTGTIAFIRITGTTNTCAVVWGIVSAIILFVLALPPTFSDVAILGYVDFTSIVSAILITIVATGVQAAKSEAGLTGVEWSVWPPADVDFHSAFLSATNIIFAYSFAVCQFSFMTEMHTPEDFVKSIWALGLIEIVIYTGAGALIYAFVGNSVASPALLSAGPLISRIAFGVAIPVIYISGSINTTTVARYMLDTFWEEGSEIRLIASKAGWMVWIGICAALTVAAFVIAEAIPFFNALLGLMSSLFVSGFTFYFPAFFWFFLVKEGKWNATRKNILLSIVNGFILFLGIVILVCGSYSSIKDISDSYKAGKVRSPFTCDAAAYA